MAAVSCGVDGGAPTALVTVSRLHAYGGGETAQHRFLVNAGEGLQRLLGERRLKLQQTRGCFFTRLSAEAVGGYAGLLLALSGIGLPSLRVLGPPGVAALHAATATFVRRRFPAVSAGDVRCAAGGGAGPVLAHQEEPGGVEVWVAAASWRPSGCWQCSDSSSSDDSSSSSDSSSEEDDEPEPKPDHDPPQHDQALAFLFKAHGHTVVVSLRRSGLEQVCPAHAHAAVVRLAELPEALPRGASQLGSATRLGAALHEAAPELYPPPAHLREPGAGVAVCDDDAGGVSVSPLEATAAAGEPPPDDPPLRRAPDNRAVADVLRNRPGAWARLQPAAQPPPPPDDVEVVALGTGCATPSKRRNAACTLVARLRGGRVAGGLLLDCGEGAAGQLRRRYGRDDAVLGVLDAVWVSHHHADHHCGLASLLTAHARRCAAAHPLKRRPPLLVVAPRHVLEYLAAAARALPGGLAYRAATCQEMSDPRHPLRGWLLQQAGVTQLLAVPVTHCHDAHALVATFADGFRVAYSGDATPSRALAAAARGATVLVHEATFDDSRADDAARKRHSTVSQALAVAADMAAQLVVLTHFSQRYPALAQEGVAGARVLLAHDLMSVRVSVALAGGYAEAVERVGALFSGSSSGSDSDSDEDG